MTPDFFIANHGSILLLHPRSKAARDWADEHLPEDRMTWGAATVVEPRYIDNIVTGIINDGLTVKGH